MSLLHDMIRVEIHRETAVAILDNVLEWGDKGKIARAAGITAEYFSRLRQIDTPPPSPKIAERIAQNVRLDPEQRHDLFTHLLQLNEIWTGIEQSIQEDDHKLWLEHQALWELKRAHHLATYSMHPRQAHTYYRALFGLGRYLVEAFHRLGYRLAAVRAHTLLQDALAVLNRPGHGLYHAKMARAILETIDERQLGAAHGLVFYDGDYHEHVIDFDNLYANAIRIEAACYHDLGDDRRANALYDLGTKSNSVKRDPNDLLPHFLRERVSAATTLSTKTMRDIEQDAFEGRTLCDGKGDAVGSFLVQRTLAKAYLTRGYIHEAKAMFTVLTDTMDTAPIGQLHRAMLLSDLAAFHHVQGHKQECNTFVAAASHLAQRAGLLKMLRDLDKRYNHLPRYTTTYERADDESP
jgi:hypothetical protein